jgi:tubulin monoglycylase TTLL3/8
MVENRKNSHEMFGYDFMIDERYGVWLIEVNSSPAMDYSTVISHNSN